MTRLQPSASSRDLLHPPTAWARGWGGHWTLCTFDIPRAMAKVRSRFWRWLKKRHFGLVQGGLWISPDPVPELVEAAVEAGMDRASVMVFTGNPAGGQDAQSLVLRAWDFQAIHAAYEAYLALGRQVPANNDLAEDGPRALARRERSLWRAVMQMDPLLPRELLPRGYLGEKAWSLRQRLHEAPPER